VRDVGGRAHGGQFRLVGDALGQGARHRRQKVGGREFVPHPAHGDRARVVHRDQDGGTPDPVGHAAQRGEDVVRGGSRERWGMQLAYIARRADGTSRAIRDDVYFHSRPAERTRRPQRSVVKGVPVDPQYNSGDADVE
jgi:hypothetical protein